MSSRNQDLRMIFLANLLLPQVVRKGGLNAVFDSQAEKFLSQKGQSTKSTNSILLVKYTECQF